MSQPINLQELERLAYRRTYQDGLYDIYLGGMLASFASFAFISFPGNETDLLTQLTYNLIGIGLSSLIFWLGKKFITLPRIGMVKFGPSRQKSKKDLILALAVIVAVQVLVILLQFSNLLSPAVSEWLAPALGQVENGRMMIAVIAAIFVAPGMLLIAYKAAIPRGYYHAVIMVLAVFLMILLDQAWWMVLGGVVIVLPGLVQFFQFLQRYPLEKAPHESP